MRLCKSVCKDCASGLLWPARSLNGVGLARFHGLIRVRVPSCDNKPAAQLEEAGLTASQIASTVLLTTGHARDSADVLNASMGTM